MQDQFADRRAEMVEHQLVARGISAPLVLKAMRCIPREAFLPVNMHEFAYDDTPLPIAEGQTISQPYIVGLMIEALDLKGGEKVLEIGTGTGYAAAVLAQIAGEVTTVERIGALAGNAASAIRHLGYTNIRVHQGDGSTGWAADAPYDAIVVAAGSPEVPASLKRQLKVGGRLVIPVGADVRAQELLRITRTGANEYKTEDLADVRFVPLVGQEGWGIADARPKPPAAKSADAARLIAERAEQFPSIDSAELGPLLERIGDARIVLLGEATHGTSEFYRMRDRITQALIEQKGFRFVAVEADWPDAARIDHYVRHASYPPSEWTAFARFPTWMWRNAETRNFVDWLRGHNGSLPHEKRVAFHGLDLYSMNTSIRAVLEYLDRVDPSSAKIARQRYGCLTPWQKEPAAYGHAALSGSYQTCEGEVLSTLRDLLRKQRDYAMHDGERFLDAVQNAKLVADAEEYYRIMYYGSRASWNLRDNHMFQTLRTLLGHYGPDSKTIVWAHNSHVGDASATDMGLRGEFNIGELCRQNYGQSSYAIGFGTDIGTVAAASDWDAPMEVMKVRPALEGSYEALCRDSGVPSFLLPLGTEQWLDLREALAEPRLERAIGVVYRPETEFQSHYFRAKLPRQFDEYCFIRQTAAVAPFRTEEVKAFPDLYPFGL